MKRRIFLSILFVMAILLVYNFELVRYSYGQAKGQFSILYNAKPINEFLANPTYPDSLKQRIKLIQEIRQFAFDSLGIKHSDNYTTLYDQKGSPVLWMVTACEPYRLEPKTWSFPIIGSFSYKGYFDSLKAENAIKELKKDGYDTDLGEVSGWSTLGWFQDPILSSMLYKSEGNLANLIIHELTHGTLYVKNNVEYNENLASFVGDQGALRFLKFKYGLKSPQYQEYISYKQDYKKFVRVILNVSLKLDQTYKSWPKQMSIAEKEKLKKQFISDFKQSFDTVTFSKPKRFVKSIQQDTSMNNNFFMHYVRYRKQQDVFEEEFKTKFNSDFKRYFEYLKKKYPKGLMFSNFF